MIIDCFGNGWNQLNKVTDKIPILTTKMVIHRDIFWLNHFLVGSEFEALMIGNDFLQLFF